jgi:hypothetical protein
MSSFKSNRQKSLEEIVLSRLMRLNATIHGIVFGLTFGFIVFLATNWLLIKGGDVVGPNLSLLGQFFIGYRVTFIGSLIGFAYAFVTGFLIGFFIAVIYNWVADLRDGDVQRAS